MQFTVVDADERTLWLAAMASAGADDVYFLPEYHQLYNFRDGRCLAYVARDAGETLFYPFRVRPVERIGTTRISSRLNDVESVYGYTGPTATTDSGEFLAQAWRGFDTWCRDNGVVAEFIRFNPLLRTDRFAAPHTEISLNRETVTVRLDGDEERLWQSYSSAHRNKIRKAKRLGLTWQEADLDEDLGAFVRLYEATMHRRDAPAFYHFPRIYYDLMRRILRDSVKLFIVKRQGETVAAALFLVAGDTAHYHLSGSCADAQRLAPNNLMLYEAAIWAQRHGFKRLHLGGGRTTAPDDPLLVFKKGISRETTPHYFGRRIHDQTGYENLCKLWMREHGEPASQSYFPSYRLSADQLPRREHAA